MQLKFLLVIIHGEESKMLSYYTVLFFNTFTSNKAIPEKQRQNNFASYKKMSTFEQNVQNEVRLQSKMGIFDCLCLNVKQ